MADQQVQEQVQVQRELVCSPQELECADDIARKVIDEALEQAPLAAAAASKAQANE